MRGEIVPPSKLIVKKKSPPRGGFLFGVVLIKGGRLQDSYKNKTGFL